MKTQSSILIVEDVSADIDLLNRILCNDYTLYIAKSGDAAIRHANESKPDLILLDIILPGDSGFDVLSTLKKSNETRDIPVIIITGLNNAKYEEKGLSLGAVDYITKPFHSAVIRARIEMHFQILRYIRTIEELGLLDSLTDLPNRRSFDNLLTVEWSRAVREKTTLNLLMLDIDHFRIFNDTYGQPQGDQLILAVGQTVSETLKRPADLTARVGGDKFAVLLPNTDTNGATVIARQIRSRVETMPIPFVGNGDPVAISASIGLASMIPTREDSIEDFIALAETKLRAAKDSGGNRVVS